MTQDTITPEGHPVAPAAAQPQYQNYWGVEETHRFTLPDGHQHFDIRPMNEGAKLRFQKLTNKGIRMNQATNDAHIDTDPGQERHTLITESVTSWLIMQPDTDGSWTPLPCPENDSRRKRILEDEILKKFNPKVIQDLEFFIRTKNPWMQADQTVEEIDEEIDRLQILRRQAQEREAGEGSSANK